jgi:hypothetical protein
VDIREWYDLPIEIREFWLKTYNDMQEEARNHAG